MIKFIKTINLARDDVDWLQDMLNNKVFSIFFTVFRLAFWVLAIGIQLGWVPIPDSFISTVISVAVVLIIPGWLLADILFRRENLGLIEKLSMAFVLGIGLVIIPAYILLIMHSQLSSLVSVSAVINLGLIVIYEISHIYRKQNRTVTRKNEMNQAREKKKLEAEVLLLTVILLTSSVLLVGFIKSELGMYRGSDGWSYAAYIRAYVDDDSLNPYGVIQLRHDARVAHSGWLAVLATLIKVSQTNFIDVYWYYLSPIFVSASLACYYTFARTLFRDEKVALFATQIQVIYYATTLGRDTFYRHLDGLTLMYRITEDKVFVTWIVLPITLTFVLYYLKNREKKYLIAFILCAAAAVITHPMGYVFLGVVLGAFFLAAIWNLWVSRRNESNGDQKRGSRISRLHVLRAKLEENRDFTGLIILLFILVCLTFIPLLARQEIIAGGSLAFSPEESPRGSEYMLDFYAEMRGMIMLSLDWYLASPSLLMHPFIILALLLTPFLVRYIRKEREARLLFVYMILPLFLIFNPITASLLGKFITPSQIWRFRWMLPISLVISFILYKLVRIIQKQRYIEARKFVVPIFIVFCLTFGSSNIIQQGMASAKEELDYGRSVSTLQRDVLEFLHDVLTEKSVVWSDMTMERYIPAFSSNTIPLAFRGGSVAEAGVVADIEKFFTSQVIDRKILDILEQYGAQYVLIDATSPLVKYLSNMPYTFRVLYQNDAYQFYEVMTDSMIGPAVTADLLVVQGDYEQASGLYEEAMKLEPDNALVYFGLARVNRLKGRWEDALANYQRFALLCTDQSVLLDNLQVELDIDPSVVLDFINEGDTYQSKSGFNVLYNFIDHLDDGYIISDNPNQIKRSAFLIDSLPEGVIFQHPPSRISFQILIPGGTLKLALALNPSVWQPGKGDGVQFDIYIDNGEVSKNILSHYIDPKNIADHRRWHNYELDLSPWSGQNVTITFATSCGPNSNCDYDWSAWGEPYIVQPVYYDFLDHFSDVIQESLDTEFMTADIIKQTINSETRKILIQSPSSRVTYSTTLPAQSSLYFGLGMSEEVWTQENGDGAQYSIYIRDPEEPLLLYRVYQKSIDPIHNPADRHWFDERINLNRFGGKTVEIIFEALPGPENNSDFDWGGWSRPVIIDETMP